MIRTISPSLFAITILLLCSNFHCSSWEDYNKNISIKVNTEKVKSDIDIEMRKTHLLIKGTLPKKVNAVDLKFYYLSNSTSKKEKSMIGKTHIIPNENSEISNQSVFEFKYQEEKMVYVEQIVHTNKNSVTLPLILLVGYHND